MTNYLLKKIKKNIKLIYIFTVYIIFLFNASYISAWTKSYTYTSIWCAVEGFKKGDTNALNYLIEFLSTTNSFDDSEVFKATVCLSSCTNEKVDKVFENFLYSSNAYLKLNSLCYLRFLNPIRKNFSLISKLKDMAMNDSLPLIRYEAIRILDELYEQDNDDMFDIVMTNLYSLTNLNKERKKGTLRLDTETYFSRLLRLACNLLSSSKNEKCFDSLVKQLNTNNIKFKLTIIRLIGSLYNKNLIRIKALPFLEKLCTEEDNPEIKEKINKAIESLKEELDGTKKYHW